MASNDRFGRNYSLTVQYGEGQNVVIALPFTLEFDVNRNDYSSSNVSSLRVYGLAPDTRNKLRKDLQGGLGAVTKRMILRAGYGSNLVEILNANMKQGFSYREGNTFITEMDAYDAGGAFANSQTSREWIAGTDQKQILSDIISDLKPWGISEGQISNAFGGAIPTGNSYSGVTCDLLKQLTNGNFFIDNGKAHCLAEGDCIQGVLTTINADTGLLGTPRRFQSVMDFDILFEPRLLIGQFLNLVSSTGDGFNGTHKVIKIHHKGTISDAICGDAITSVRCEFGTFNLAGASSP